MQAFDFWKAVVMDTANLFESVIAFLYQHGIRFCVIGGQAVNAYVEPLVSLDLVLAVAVESLEELEKQLAEQFIVKKFPHSLNLSTRL